MRLIKTAVVCELDKPNKNGHIYPTDVMERAIERYKEKNASMFGQLGMPAPQIENMTPQLDDVSHIIQDLKIEDGKLIATIETLDTERGCLLMGIMSVTEMDFRTAGQGTVSDDGTITEFELHSINAVMDGA